MKQRIEPLEYPSETSSGGDIRAKINEIIQALNNIREEKSEYVEIVGIKMKKSDIEKVVEEAIKAQQKIMSAPHPTETGSEKVSHCCKAKMFNKTVTHKESWEICDKCGLPCHGVSPIDKSEPLPETGSEWKPDFKCRLCGNDVSTTDVISKEKKLCIGCETNPPSPKHTEGWRENMRQTLVSEIQAIADDVRPNLLLNEIVNQSDKIVDKLLGDK